MGCSSFTNDLSSPLKFKARSCSPSLKRCCRGHQLRRTSQDTRPEETLGSRRLCQADFFGQINTFFSELNHICKQFLPYPKAAPNGRPWAPVLLGKGFRFGFSINQLKNQICDPQCNEDNDNDSQSPCPIGSESGRNRSGRTNKQSLSKKFSVGSVY